MIECHGFGVLDKAVSLIKEYGSFEDFADDFNSQNRALSSQEPSPSPPKPTALLRNPARIR
jgi:hypothetical protein